MKSRIAWSYARCELGDVRLLRTADLDCSRSGSRRTVLGLRLRFDLGMPALSAEHALHDRESRSVYMRTKSHMIRDCEKYERSGVESTFRSTKGTASGCQIHR